MATVTCWPSEVNSQLNTFATLNSRGKEESGRTFPDSRTFCLVYLICIAFPVSSKTKQLNLVGVVSAIRSVSEEVLSHRLDENHVWPKKRFLNPLGAWTLRFLHPKDLLSRRNGERAIKFVRPPHFRYFHCEIRDPATATERNISTFSQI